MPERSDNLTGLVTKLIYNFSFRSLKGGGGGGGGLHEQSLFCSSACSLKPRFIFKAPLRKCHTLFYKNPWLLFQPGISYFFAKFQPNWFFIFFIFVIEVPVHSIVPPLPMLGKEIIVIVILLLLLCRKASGQSRM